MQVRRCLTALALACTLSAAACTAHKSAVASTGARPPAPSAGTTSTDANKSRPHAAPACQPGAGSATYDGAHPTSGILCLRSGTTMTLTVTVPATQRWRTPRASVGREVSVLSATAVGVHHARVRFLARSPGVTTLYLSAAGYKLPVWQLVVHVR